MKASGQPCLNDAAPKPALQHSFHAARVFHRYRMLHMPEASVKRIGSILHHQCHAMQQLSPAQAVDPRPACAGNGELPGSRERRNAGILCGQGYERHAKNKDGEENHAGCSCLQPFGGTRRFSQTSRPESLTPKALNQRRS